MPHTFTRARAAGAVLVATTLAGIASGTASSAQATPQSGPVAVAAAHPAATQVVIARRHVDVDGDGRRDKVVLARRGAGATIAVTTAKKKTATRYFTNMDGIVGDFRWRYAAHLDGARGAELVIRTGVCGISDCDIIFTWRNNRLITVDQNRKNALDPRYWTSAGPAAYVDGYTFTKINGTPVVRVWSIDRPTRTSRRYHAYTSTSRWNGRGWNHAVDQEVTVPATRAAWNRIVGTTPRDISTR